MAPNLAAAAAVTLMGAIALKLTAAPTDRVASIVPRRVHSRDRVSVFTGTMQSPGGADGKFSGETLPPQTATATRTRPRAEVRAEGARGRHGVTAAEGRGLGQVMGWEVGWGRRWAGSNDGHNSSKRAEGASSTGGGSAKRRAATMARHATEGGVGARRWGGGVVKGGGVSPHQPAQQPAGQRCASGRDGWQEATMPTRAVSDICPPP